ncbi:ABC transporter permease [Luteimonas sp. e5]
MNMDLRTVFTVMKKELRDFQRDRKTFLMTMLLAPLMYPLLMLGIGKLAEARTTTQLEKALTIPVAGGEHAPNLLAHLASQGISVRAASEAEVEAAVRNQDEEVGLVIDADFRQDWHGGKPARVDVVTDSTRRNSDVPAGRVRTAVQAYAQQVGGLRLLARGVNPMVGMPVMVGNRDMATPEAKRGILLTMIMPIILMIFAFIGGAHLAMDTTAGERERQSLEPLLATPASRGAIVSGKMLSAAVIGISVMVLIMLSFKLSAALTPGIGRMLDVSLSAIGSLLLALLPLALIGTALLTLLAAGSKSMKEAQVHMTWLMFLPMLPAYALMVYPIKDTALWQYAVPFLSQNQLIQKITRGEAPLASQWAVYLACSLALALVLWLLAVWRYRQEKLAISS